MQTIGIVGAGAWGTALATVAARAGRTTLVWAREAEVASAINESHENTLFLKGQVLDPAIRATDDMADLAAADLILLVAPAQHTRSVVESLTPHIKDGVPLVICSKGIERGTGALMSELVESVLPDHVTAALSGPTFAHEVAKGLPAAVTLASEDEVVARAIAGAIGSPTFRPYWTDDIVGTQIGGSVKNVLAIACGIVEGRKLGENARAALITRGMAEMVRFALNRGAKRETLMGLCGIGDLILTCSSLSSRNMSLGFELGQGREMEEILAERRTVAEGAHTAEILNQIAKSENIDMPIAAAVYAVLYGGESVDAAIDNLLTRPFAREDI